MSQEQKELSTWSKMHFWSFLKCFQLSEIVWILRVGPYTFWFNPFLANVLILYHFNTLENLWFIWCFQGVQIGKVGQKWINNFESKILYIENQIYTVMFLCIYLFVFVKHSKCVYTFQILCLLNSFYWYSSWYYWSTPFLWNFIPKGSGLDLRN